jgi:transposase
VSSSNSRLALGHLLRDQQIDFALMVLVVRQTRAHLRPGQSRKAGRRDAVDGLAVLQQTDDIMNPDAPVRSCYEAGRDGFWVHRWLVGAGVENVVVEASSIEVNRRARRAKPARQVESAREWLT